MNPASILFALIVLLLSSSLVAETYTSKYAGEEKRVTKSLSEADIQELQKGGGWGFAKVAELNGYPGPAHILQMQEQIGLTDEQRLKVQELFDQMQKQAQTLGLKYIELETQLNDHFAESTIDSDLLLNLTQEIADVRAQLRRVHLQTHLQTPLILTEDQIQNYNQLRGYSNNTDPCKNIPEGHSEVMWKKHHNCN